MVHITLFDGHSGVVERIARNSTMPSSSLWKNVVSDEESFRAYPRYLLIEDGPQSSVTSLEGAWVRMRGSYQPTSHPSRGAAILGETQGVYVVFCYARDGLDDEFNRWYDATHLPDAMALGIYGHGTRYKLATRPTDPFVAPYLSIYETPHDPKSAFLRWIEFRGKWAEDPDWARLLGFIASGGFARMSSRIPS